MANKKSPPYDNLQATAKDNSIDESYALKVIIEGMEIVPQHVSLADYEISKCIQVGVSRDIVSSPLELEGDQIGELVFEDGTEWIGYVGDFHEIFPNVYAHEVNGSEIWKFPTSLQYNNTRGVVENTLIKLINLFTPKLELIKNYEKRGKNTSENLALQTDKRILTEGMYKVDKDFNLIPLQNNQELQGKILLLLHGTLSSTKSSFSGLQGATWDKLQQIYDHIISLEHYTLSKSPIENAIDVLHNIPSNMSIDILSHARGGLIGDILSRHDIQNNSAAFGYSEEEIQVLAQEVPKDLIVKLKQLADAKFLTINNFVRVACPAGGITLVGERLDHYLNALLNGIGFLIGGKANLLYSIVKEFLLHVVESRVQAHSIPGLCCMVPSSAYQKINNRRDQDVKSKLFVIAGDSTISDNVGKTLLVMLSNLYSLKANDLVVDTISMKRGLSRAAGLYQYISRDSKTSHFNYFNNDNTRRYILMGLQNVIIDGPFTFEYISKSNMDRGIDITFKMIRYNFDNVSGKRPIAILLPGIMGSLLNDTEGNVWVNVPRFLQGDFVSKLKLDSPSIFADGVMANSYKKIGEFLLEDNDLKVLAYDWRKSLAVVAKELNDLLERYMKDHDQPINIIAHSMGGLIVKQIIANKKELWSEFCAGPKNNLILLGTPWLGSHLIMEVLTGHSKRIKQLDLLDWKNGKTEILKTINQFPGIFQLLPITDEGFENQKFWTGIAPYVKNMVIPSQDMLDQYKLYATKSKTINLGEQEKNKVFYIAGKGDTVNGYYIKKEFFSGKVLKYTSTPAGDGSVTYELGIPKDLLSSHLTFVNVSHGNLANDEKVFKEIKAIFKNGKLDSSSRGMSRSEEQIFETFVMDEKSNIVLAGEEDDILNNLFDIKEEITDSESYKQELTVSIVNADLKYANYAVMVGHFKNDGIYSAERSLDRSLNNKLSERHKLGFYPADVGDCELTFHKHSKPKGAIVIGLGKQEELTPYLLAKSVESAIIKQAFFFRDNYGEDEQHHYGRALSAVIIGNSFAGLSLEDSIGAIVSGVIKGNRKILKLDIGLLTIQEIEFLDHYEDIAQQAYQILKNFKLAHDDAHFELKPYRQGLGSKKRNSAYRNATWWHIFNTTTIYADNDLKTPLGLSYNSTSGKARVEQEVILSDLTIMEHLSKTLSSDANWRKDVSKSLFELLIPNDFKSILRNQKNILIKLDEYTAQFPWEMFHYFDEESNSDDIPTFVNTGLIRQLIIDDYRVNPVVVDKDTALVIGDPDYSNSNISQLPSAAEEARIVSQLLEENAFETISLINSKSEDIVINMFSNTYKIMHFAAHGVFEKVKIGNRERVVAGIVLGDGIFLEPGMINQLSSIPEFIFINCCYSGTMGKEDNKYTQFKPKLAANIGTQLIKMGVKAVVVSGWAVDDAAAMTFSKELYTYLFNGYEFGVAVQKARKLTYISHRNTNTWGAYQCYGDYYYKLNNKNPDHQKEEVFVTSTQAVFELDNFLSTIQSSIVNVNTQLEKLNAFKNRIDAEQLENAEILERYAFVFSELGKFCDAKCVFESLFKQEGSKFSISSLEKYHSISGKLHLEKYTLLKASAALKNDDLIHKEIANCRLNVDTLLQEANIIFKLGDTVDRLSHIANMYKRASMLYEHSDKSEYMIQVKEYSLRAYILSLKTLPLKDQIFPFTNYLLALYFVKNGVVELKDVEISLGKHKSVQSYLKDLFNQVNTEESMYTGFYHANTKVKVLACWCIYEPKNNNMLFDKLESAMVWSLEYYGNVKNIYGEIEQLEFLMSITSDQDKKSRLGQIRDKINLLLS